MSNSRSCNSNESTVDLTRRARSSFDAFRHEYSKTERAHLNPPVNFCGEPSSQ
jgi:hypothetical protein